MVKKLIVLAILVSLLAACVPVPAAGGATIAGAAGGSLTAVSAAFGGGFGSTGCTITSAGNISCDGNAVIKGTTLITGTTTLAGAANLNGINTIGDGGDTVAINSSDWDIGATGAMTGIGALTMDGVLAANGGITATTLTSAGDVTLTTDATGGNAGAKTELIGLPRVKLVSLGAGTNGATETTLYIPAADPATSWVAISTTVTSSNDTSIRRVGVNSLKLAFGATAVNDNGAAIDITNDDLEADNESIGFWIRSDTALDAGDLDLLIDDTDAAPDTTFDVCAVATVNVWQWCEIDYYQPDGRHGQRRGQDRHCAERRGRPGRVQCLAGRHV